MLNRKVLLFSVVIGLGALNAWACGDGGDTDALDGAIVSYRVVPGGGPYNSGGSYFVHAPRDEGLQSIGIGDLPELAPVLRGTLELRVVEPSPDAVFELLIESLDIATAQLRATGTRGRIVLLKEDTPLALRTSMIIETGGERVRLEGWMERQTASADDPPNFDQIFLMGERTILVLEAVRDMPS